MLLCLIHRYSYSVSLEIVVDYRKLKSFQGTHNPFHNILRLFDVKNFFLSPQVKRCAIITYKHGIYELPHELPNDLTLRILGKEQISGKCLNPIE